MVKFTILKYEELILGYVSMVQIFVLVHRHITPYIIYPIHELDDQYVTFANYNLIVK